MLLEVKSGEGGEESALFAGDLLRMYSRYAERHGWTHRDPRRHRVRPRRLQVGDRRGEGQGHPEPGEAPFALLKFEGGVHRVQRVPVTESQGRVHTSAAGVLVMPEAEPVEVQIEDKDLRIDVFRSSGPGGQSVNTTDSAVRITHVPTGIVASCQNEKSQLQNREQAMRILRARILAVAEEEANAEASDARRSQVRTVDRSERIRTYNYAENRISDHRTGYKSYDLDRVLDGDLEAVIASCVDADMAARLDRSPSEPPAPGVRPRVLLRDATAGSRRPASPARSTTPPSCSPTSSAPPAAGCRWSSRSTPTRRAAFAALVDAQGRAGAAPAPDRLRGLPPRRAAGRPRRLRPAPGDRAPGRLGDRARRRGGGGARSSSTSAAARAPSP